MANKKLTQGSHRAWWRQRRDVRQIKLNVWRAGRKRRTRLARAIASTTKTSIISMPNHLVVERDEQRAELKKIIDSAFAILGRANTRVKFDFSRVSKIFPGGMLVFLAHLELMTLLYPGRVAVRAPPNSIAAQLIDHFGINGLLGMSPPANSPHDESVIHWRYLTGMGADGQKINELLDYYKREVVAEIPEGLYDVLAEAFTNVRHHAFPESSTVPEILKRWWLFSRYVAPKFAEKGYLYIAIYDIGVGIQASLRNKLTTGEWILDAKDEIFSIISTTQTRRLERLLLKRAVENERSSTGLENRGLGLPEMKEFVLTTEAGRLYILSGQAQYSCVASTGKGEVFDCVNGFPGTLILWGLPLAQKDP